MVAPGASLGKRNQTIRKALEGRQGQGFTNCGRGQSSHELVASTLRRGKLCPCSSSPMPSLRDFRRILGASTSDWHPRLSTAIASRFDAASIGTPRSAPSLFLPSSCTVPARSVPRPLCRRSATSDVSSGAPTADWHPRLSTAIASRFGAASIGTPRSALSLFLPSSCTVPGLRALSPAGSCTVPARSMPSLRDFRRILGVSYLGLASEAINCHRFAIRCS